MVFAVETHRLRKTFRVSFNRPDNTIFVPISSLLLSLFDGFSPSSDLLPGASHISVGANAFLSSSSDTVAGLWLFGTTKKSKPCSTPSKNCLFGTGTAQSSSHSVHEFSAIIFEMVDLKIQNAILYLTIACQPSLRGSSAARHIRTFNL